jgi:hypothetical protein
MFIGIAVISTILVPHDGTEMSDKAGVPSHLRQ